MEPTNSSPSPSQDPLPQRQGAGRRNLDLFLAGSKSSPICFYFEDEGCEELYIRFLVRLFPSYPRPLVICTGGKSKKEVLADAGTHQLSPVIFLQDKDFDDLIGVVSDDPRVITLHRYSFENYLLERDALVELAIESKRRLRRAAAAEQLALDEYLAALYESYRPLAALFVTARKLNLKRLKTTKQPISDLVAPGSVMCFEGDVNKFHAKVLEAAFASQRISAAGDLEGIIASALTPKPQYVGYADPHANAHLCGKHLVDLTLAYVDRVLGTTLGGIDRFEISMRLLAHVSLASFERVRNAIVTSLIKQCAPQEVLSLLK